LEKVVVAKDKVIEALSGGGTACDLGELKKRFDALLDTLTKGKDSSKIRIVIE
jgi:hypothetical protein